MTHRDGHPGRTLTRLLCAVQPATAAREYDVRQRLDRLTKPPGSLGRLEDLAVRLAMIYGDPPPPLHRRLVFVLAADHGVAGRGVSAYPAEVTAQMCRNFIAGGAAINAIAGATGAEVCAVDIGVDADPEDLAGLVQIKVRPGSRDLSRGPALTEEETIRAIEAGAALARNRASDTDIFALGEMGIGNTTAASAVATALTGRSVSELVGPGAGLAAERIDHKREIIEVALRRLAPNVGPIEILQQVGGLEIAGLAGVALGAAAAGRAVVIDGFIASTAALAAVRLCPAAADYLFASHRSAEPGHAIVLAALGLRPLLDFDMRLGEGTGAALVLPIMDAAGSILREMATFESAGIASSAQTQSSHTR